MAMIPAEIKPVVDSDELVARIRLAANRANGLPGSAGRAGSASDLPPVPGPLPIPPSSTPIAADTMRPESLLDQAASLLRGGRVKNTAPKAVPKWLRPLFRNQGGYNSVVLEAAERLVEVSRGRRQQSYDVHERLIDLQTWAHTVVELSAESREWMLAADARLQALTTARPGEPAEGSASRDLPAEAAPSPSNLDSERLARLTAHVEAMEAERRTLNDHLHRLRAQLDEQAAYIRTVHHHLDQLGAHVDAALAPRDLAK